MTTNLDQARAQVREDVRYRLAGLTRREITRATIDARNARDTYAALHARHGGDFAASATRTAALYTEHLRIWQSLSRQTEVYDPTAA